MAIEIRELIIKGTVGSSAQSGTEEDTDSSETNGQQYQLIQTCVDKVLEIIDQKSKR